MVINPGRNRYGRTIGDAISPEANVYPSVSLSAVVSAVVGVAFQVGIGPLIFRHALVLVCNDVLLRAPENIDRLSAMDTRWVFRHQPPIGRSEGRAPQSWHTASSRYC